MASKRYASVNRKDCVACGTCIRTCPRQAISVFRGCYAAVDTELCVGCGLCTKVCPTGCIELMNREVVK